MTNILVTAFDVYGHWQANASWLTLIEFVKELPERPSVTTRLYPVDFAAVREKLAEDLAADYDVALHLGQAPGATHVQLEAIGVNVGGREDQRPDEFEPLVADGPVAYRSRLPLARLAEAVRDAGIPAGVSYHAGTFLCNAVLYLSHHLAESMKLKTQAAFIHVPLDPSQVAADPHPRPSMPASVSAAALHRIVADLA